MPPKQHNKQATEQTASNQPPRNAAIAGQVLGALGQPDRLHCVQVRALWDAHYRVNVFVGVDAASATVAHSYFLVTDGEGLILTSTPKITRRY